MAVEGIGLTAPGSGQLQLTPRGILPRAEKAFARSAAHGMLDLVQHGLPVGAETVLAWLQEQTRLRLMRYLRALRRADAAASAELTVTGENAADLLASMPPLQQGTVCAGDICGWFAGLEAALHECAALRGCSVEEWLCRLGEGWQQLGMLCLHLAENGGADAAEAPFAFLATYIHKAGQDGKPRHAPLGLAAQMNDNAALAALLRPLQQVAADSPFWQQLIRSGDIYRPCAWGARRAYDFLESLPLLESAGIETRMVNLWKTQPPRAELQVQLEKAGDSKDDRAPSLNINSLLRFVPRVVLGNQALTDEELAELLAADEDGLVRFRGEWIRLDRERLQHLLNSWRQAARMAAGGIPLVVGLRWLLGKRPENTVKLPPEAEDVPATAAPELEEALRRLTLGSAEPDLPESLCCILRPYQREGVRFLLGVTESGFGACLADDMGLGKTLQVTSWLAHLHRQGILAGRAALIVAPASLLSNWQEEIARFAPQLRTILLHPDTLTPGQTDTLRRTPMRLLEGVEVALTTYGMVTRLAELLAKEELPALVLDEAQAIKNAGSQRTKAILQLVSPRRVALTGTPVENNLSELRALFDFLTPGLLGSEKEFNTLVQSMGTDLSPLRRRIRPFLLRRLKSDPTLLPDLPPKTEKPAYCLLTAEQTRLYAHEVESLRAVIAEPDPQTRLSLVLPLLSRLKQICNHPAQYRGEGYFDPAASGKMQRLGHLARAIADAGDSCLVFTQYRSTIEPLHDFLSGIFGSPGLTLHGGTTLAERRERVNAFRHPGGPRFFILSLKAAGTGLTLTRARHVIHFDRWWNPAVENQASDRAYRIGQTQPVLIHPLICCGTIEENIHRMLTAKRALADNLLSGGLEKLLLTLPQEELTELLGLNS